jgi:hypothetical protein
MISELEEELLNCKLRVVEHMITLDDLKNMRKNFRRERKLRLFNQSRLDGLSFDPHEEFADTERRYY